jgi:FKBP-type peptidyl-prolyl cis-trans isomerase SlyD
MPARTWHPRNAPLSVPPPERDECVATPPRGKPTRAPLFRDFDKGGSQFYSPKMSKIGAGKFVVVDYVLCDEDGDVVQTSIDPDVGPLTYIHGYSPILPGLHQGLEGLSVGDKKQITVTPEEGYGDADEEGIFEVDRSELPDPANVKFGDEIVGEDEDGNEFEMHVIEVHDDHVVVDTNHPLAGHTLMWDVTVREVRDATQREVDNARADAAELEIGGTGEDSH